MDPSRCRCRSILGARRNRSRRAAVSSIMAIASALSPWRVACRAARPSIIGRVKQGQQHLFQGLDYATLPDATVAHDLVEVCLGQSEALGRLSDHLLIVIGERPPGLHHE